MTSRACQKTILVVDDIRDQLINGLVAAQAAVSVAQKRLAELERFSRDEITAERFTDELAEPTGRRLPDHVILHHSTTRDSESFSWAAIRRYHEQTLGWNNIGYHFGVEHVEGEIEILMGRMPGERGAHCVASGMNIRSVGVCVVGNFDRDEVPDGHWQGALRLVRWLCRTYRIPTENVRGHREVACDGRTCPGARFDVGRFRLLL